jgi:CheY-like chemotaxis protein
MAEQSILIVEDNPVSLKLFRILLTPEGYDVHTANDPRKLSASWGSCGRG